MELSNQPRADGKHGTSRCGSLRQATVIPADDRSDLDHSTAIQMTPLLDAIKKSLQFPGIFEMLFELII
jgi:hypothetical protein